MVEPIYQPREPKASPLYRSIRNHFAEFESVYEERYQKRFGVLRDVVRDVIYKYLGCGDLRNGFALIKCKVVAGGAEITSLARRLLHA